MLHMENTLIQCSPKHEISVCTLDTRSDSLFTCITGNKVHQSGTQSSVGNYQFLQHDLQSILKHNALSELSSLIQSLSTQLDLLLSKHDIILEHDFLSIVFNTPL